MERSVCKSAAQPRSLFCCLHPVETTDVRGSEPFAHARTTLPRETRQDVAPPGYAGKVPRVRLTTSGLWQLASSYRQPYAFTKFFLQYLSHRIFRHMHEVLNIVKKITNYTI